MSSNHGFDDRVCVRLDAETGRYLTMWTLAGGYASRAALVRSMVIASVCAMKVRGTGPITREQIDASNTPVPVGYRLVPIDPDEEPTLHDMEQAVEPAAEPAPEPGIDHSAPSLRVAMAWMGVAVLLCLAAAAYRALAK